MSTSDQLRPEDTATPQHVVEPAEKPEGPIVAAILAGGIGCFAMGVFTTLGEASTDFADWLTWDDDVGPLSGKTIMTVIVWLVSWTILHVIYRNRAADTRKALAIALVLVALGIVGTFPTFFHAFSSE